MSCLSDSKTVASSTGKPVLFWYAHRLFDTSVDSATWIEMLKELNTEYDTIFFSLWKKEPAVFEYIPGKQVRYMPQMGKGMIQKVSREYFPLFRLGTTIAKTAPKIIMVNSLKMPVLRAIGRSGARLDCPIVLDVRTLPTSGSHRKAWIHFEKSLQYAASQYSGITYITERMFEYCSERFSLPEHRHAFWSSAVNTDLFKPEKREEDGFFRMIYHGGILSVCRGLDRLVEAMAYLRDLPIKLTLVTSLRESAILSLRRDLGLMDVIELVDTIPHSEIPRMINRHDIGVIPLPSNIAWNTSSPLKLFEYLSCGKPVVVTDIPAHSDLLRKKKVCLFCR